jgi:hypothetical protein
MSGDEVAHGVAAELLPRCARELERDASFRDDGERLDCGDVAPLHECLACFAGGEVRRAKRAHQRRQRLHRRADDDLLSVRDARLDPARSVRLAVVTALVAQDLVMRLRAPQAG